MKKLLPILLVIVLTVGVMGAAFASAADLTVRGGTIQAGEDLDVKMYNICAVLGWGLETDDGSVHFVRLEFWGPDDMGGNNELEFFVIITGDSGQEIARSSKQITWPIEPNSDYNLPNEKFTFNHPVQAEDIYDIHVYVEGSANSGPDM